jgi:hypothetical protein
MKLLYTRKDLHTSRYTFLCAAILLSLFSQFGRLYFNVKCFYSFLCSVVLPRNYFYISLQENRKIYFVIFRTEARLTYLYVVGIIVPKTGYLQFSHNQFSPIRPKTTHCDRLNFKNYEVSFSEAVL